MPAYCHPAAYAAFAREMHRVETTPGLLKAAFSIARHERPDAMVEEAERIIADLAETVRRRVRSDEPKAKLAHLHDVLFDVVGFRGNVEDYYNPANSYLSDVLRTHRGLPITLVLVYKCVAEGIGLEVRGINAPGHFLAAVNCPELAATPEASCPAAAAWMYVDPFYGGELLNDKDVFRRVAEASGQEIPASPSWLAPATHRQWLGRILNNLEAVFAHTGRERDLYAMQELESLLAT